MSKEQEAPLLSSARDVPRGCARSAQTRSVPLSVQEGILRVLSLCNPASVLYRSLCFPLQRMDYAAPSQLLMLLLFSLEARRVYLPCLLFQGIAPDEACFWRCPLFFGKKFRGDLLYLRIQKEMSWMLILPVLRGIGNLCGCSRCFCYSVALLVLRPPILSSRVLPLPTRR